MAGLLGCWIAGWLAGWLGGGNGDRSGASGKCELLAEVGALAGTDKSLGKGGRGYSSVPEPATFH